MSEGTAISRAPEPTRAALADAARRRLTGDAVASSLPDAVFAAAALGRCTGVLAVVRGATDFEAATFEGIETDSVRVALRQVLRAVSIHEHALPAGRWFSRKRWRQLLRQEMET